MWVCFFFNHREANSFFCFAFASFFRKDICPKSLKTTFSTISGLFLSRKISRFGFKRKLFAKFFARNQDKKGELLPKPNIPESFNVLVHELRGLALEITLN